MSNVVRHGQRRLVSVSDLRRQIDLALAAGNIIKAAELAERAISVGHVDSQLLNLAAWRREEAGDFRGAHDLLKRALALDPGDVLILGSIGAVLRKEGFPDKALEILNRVVAAEPRHAAAWLERGYALEQMRSPAAAVESYEKAVALNPGMAPALGKLADDAARRGEKASARSYAARALAIDSLEPAATFALATMEIEAQEGATAETRLRRLLAAPGRPEDRIRANTLLGDSLDRQDQVNGAFWAYEVAQRHFADAYRDVLAPGPDRPSHRDFIQKISEQVAAAGVIDTLPDVPRLAGEAASHIFLIGYPRSGTTLVENILASAPNVRALEERDTLADTDDVIVANDGSMPNLDTVDPASLHAMRLGYWHRVRAMAGNVEGRVFVDMNPFNGIKLPIIARLFPRAKIVIMRRDPRDVVLSCFRINFTPSAAAWCFSDLGETARHYDALMTLTERCIERLPLAYHEVRYDKLVTDFEPTVRLLASFAGLEWTDDFRSFDRTAKSRGVQTASATQVRRGLYDGRGQWRRYREYLVPVLPILQPWVDRLGFDL